VLTAIDREKKLRGWRRSKKIALSECLNPPWLDLSRGWYSRMKDGRAQAGMLRLRLPGRKRPAYLRSA